LNIGLLGAEAGSSDLVSERREDIQQLQIQYLILTTEEKICIGLHIRILQLSRN
jgi:hypothetical protein